MESANPVTCVICHVTVRALPAVDPYPQTNPRARLIAANLQHPLPSRRAPYHTP